MVMTAGPAQPVAVPFVTVAEIGGAVSPVSRVLIFPCIEVVPGGGAKVLLPVICSAAVPPFGRVNMQVEARPPVPVTPET